MKLTTLFLTTALTALMSQNVLAASQMYFDLHAQNFSETKKEGDMIWARYDIPNSYVTTNLKHTSTYNTLDDTGFMRVDLKQPLVTWGVAIDMRYAFAYEKDRRSIILTSDNGESLIIGLTTYKSTNSSGGVIFNGKRAFITGYDERLSISMSKNDTGQITLNINGSITTVDDLDFSQLRSVEAQLIVESGESDMLNSFTIFGDQGA